MKLLIIASPDGPAEPVPERFVRMRDRLATLGIDTALSPSLPREALEALVSRERPDLAYSAPYRCAGDGEPVHATLERAGVPVVGSPQETLELALDKAALKRLWDARGVATPAWSLATDRDDPADAARRAVETTGGFPLIVKPAREGNSRGITEKSVVHDVAALVDRVAWACSEWGDAIVERFLGDDPSIREFTVALAGNGPEAFVMPAEIRFKVPKAVRVISAGDKDEHRTLATALDPGEEFDLVEGFARKAFEVAGIRDYARGDFLLSGGELSAIEINGQAMMPDRWFEACARGSGLGDERYLAAIVLAAIARARREGRHLPPCPLGLVAGFDARELARLGAEGER